jgi:malonate transporter MadL subunit
MTIYGVALLAGCYLTGIFFGDFLGRILHIPSNVGGVGFAMILLIFAQSWRVSKKWFYPEVSSAISFWNKMYIPVIIAMSAIQNAYAAFSSGFLAILAGILPTLGCFAVIPLLSSQTRLNE